MAALCEKVKKSHSVTDLQGLSRNYHVQVHRTVWDMCPVSHATKWFAKPEHVSRTESDCQVRLTLRRLTEY